MANDIRSGLIGFALGVAAGAGAALVRFRLLGDREDRPIIRVRNRDVTFETSRDWTNVLSEWHMEPSPSNYEHFVVTIEEPQGNPETLDGRSVFIECRTTEGEMEEFEIHCRPTNGRKDPKLLPAGPLAHHGGRQKLKMRKIAVITAVRVPSGRGRTFDGTTPVSIKITAYR